MTSDNFKIVQTQLPEVKCFIPEVRIDPRGAFWEEFDIEVYREALGLEDIKILKVNGSFSPHGMLRGLHHQLNKPQGKLITVTNGAVHDIALDIRVGSPTFGRYASYHLSRDNKAVLYIPPGFAHGFLALKADTTMRYSITTNMYHPKDEQGIHWNDRELGLDWPLHQLSAGAPEMNHRDAAWPTLEEARQRGLLPTYQAPLHPAQ